MNRYYLSQNKKYYNSIPTEPYSDPNKPWVIYMVLLWTLFG